MSPVFPEARLGMRVELAFGADPAGDPNLWTWVDVSDRLLDQTISPSRGRQNETSRTQPASASLVLDNPDGELTPDNPESAWWPDVVLGTPCRLSVSLDPDTPTWEERMVGNVDSWVPSWPYGDLSGPATEGESRVDITISGTIRRLSQGQAPLFSPLRRSIPDLFPSTLVAWWPLEDGAETTQAASYLATQPALVPFRFPLGPAVAPVPRFGVDGGPAGASTAVALEFIWGLGASISGVSAPFWVGEWVTNPAVPDDGGSWDALIDFANGWQIRFGVSQQIFGFRRGLIDISDDLHLLVESVQSADQPVEFDPHLFTLDVSAAGNVTISEDGVALVSTAGTYAELTGGATSLRLFGVQSDLGPSIHSHAIVVSGTLPSLVDLLDAGAGYAGEAAAVRMERLAVENNLSIVVDGVAADSEPMGPQRPATLLDLLFECADTDLGVLGEQRDTPGLTYRPRSERYNRTLAVTFDAAVDEITNPFRPILDDQRVRNDITVNRVEGSSARAFDQTDIDRRGLYDESVSVNPVDDTVLSNMAYWRLHLGTWPGMRYPKVDSELSIAPQLIADWLTVNPGDWIRVTDLPPQHPLTDVDLLVEGTTESFSPTRWTVDVVCSPAGPWMVSEIADASPSDPELLPRLDSAGAELATGIDADDTSLSVATVGPLWTTSATYVPFDVMIGGERMTVTAISGGSSPQTFTVVRSVNGITKSHIAGVEVHVARPFVLAL